MLPRLHRLLVAACFLLLAGACGTGGEDAAPEQPAVVIVASSPGSLEAAPDQRVLMALAAPDARLIGGPDTPLEASFSGPNGETATTPTEWVWAIPDVRGFYVARADFPAAGTWEVTLQGEGVETEPSPFSVLDESPLPGVGDPAPRSETRTHPEVPLDQLSTDPEPDPAFYDISLAEAVGSGTPTVVVFATPAFCQTATCGPVLDIVKEVAPAYPGVEFVHVEVYENIDAAPEEPLREVEAVVEWGLQTEPWVFVVDAGGKVAARFEGTVGAAELEEALAGLGTAG